MELSGFFHFLVTGHPFSPKEITDVQSEMSFSEAIDSHIACKARLREALREGAIQDEVAREVGDDGACALGKWILGPGYARYGKLSSFGELRRNHSDFHRLARSIVELRRSNRPEPAERLAWTEFDDASQKIVGQLRIFCRIFRT